MAKKSLQECLARAEKDSDFALKLINDPGQFKDEYELTEEQMTAIAGAGQQRPIHPKGPKDDVYEVIVVV
jgi:hypothetical protein